MNADPVNAKKSQKPIKEFLSYEFEKVFRSSKNVYWRQQVVMPYWHPCHDLPQACEGSKYVCIICIHTKENLQSRPSTSIWIN